MTKKEALQILAILKAAYPSSYTGTKEEASGTVSVWCMQFADMPADIVLMAIHQLISTNKFPPTVAEVKKKIEGLYWDACGAMNDGLRYKTITEAEKKQYERIMQYTEGYRASTIELSVKQMVGRNTPMLMGRENENG